MYDALNIIIKSNVFNNTKEGEKLYNYKFNDDFSNKLVSSYNLNKNKDDLKKIENKINDINNSFVFSNIPEYVKPELQMLEQKFKSPDEIKKDAVDSLSEYKNSNLNKINDTYKTKSDELEVKKQGLNKSLKLSKNEVSKYFDDVREKANVDALKRGLSRSSIVINQMNAFDNDELSALMDLDKDFSNNLNSINFELNSLNLQKQKALSDFDIAYAVKLNDKITSLNEELSKKNAEITKYNNQIIEKEQNYNNRYQELVKDIKNENFDKNAKMLDLVSKYGEKMVSNYKVNQIYNLLDGYFADMSQQEIIDSLNNSGLISALGNDYASVYQRYVKE